MIDPSFSLYDCIWGSPHHLSTQNTEFGSQAPCNVSAFSPIIGKFAYHNDFYWLIPNKHISSFIINGIEFNCAIKLAPSTLYCIVIDGACLVMWYGTAPAHSDFAQYNPKAWYNYNSAGSSWAGPFLWTELLGSFQPQQNLFITFLGLEIAGFPQSALTPLLKKYALMHKLPDTSVPSLPRAVVLPPVPAQVTAPPAPTHSTAPNASPVQNSNQAEPIALAAPVNNAQIVEAPLETANTLVGEEEEVAVDQGEYTCPVCWFQFDPGDVLSIAVHQNLRGDPVLGEEAMLRFPAAAFNTRSQALDAYGITCPDVACPHCRRKLVSSFFQTEQHIFSIIGAPSSGKSYYLATMIHELQNELLRTFDGSLRDADPTSNAVLNDMIAHLFSSSSPQEAYLAKTDLEGVLYETLPRQGRMTKLPKPFTYNINLISKPQENKSLVFYDNAGEHFEPGRNSADSPGAQHVTVASGLFFLFDPTTNLAFRKKSTGVNDPQLLLHKNDNQSVILAETETRIKTLLNLNNEERIDTPFAVMVGKCDTWTQLLGDIALLPAIVNQKVHLPNIKANSERIRKILFELHPTICGNAESISNNVCYFAISAFGNPPIEFIDNEGNRRIGPDPMQLEPINICDPTLWVLSQIAPNIIPHTAHS